MIEYMRNMTESESGRQLVHEVILRNLDPSNAESTEKIKEFAKTDKELYDTVVRTVGMKYYKEGKYADALNWFGETKEGAMVNKIGKQLVDTLMQKGPDALAQVFSLADVDPKVVDNSGKLSFISNYLRFRELLGKGLPPELVNAAAILLQMIRQKLLPYEYADSVLDESIPLLRTMGKDIMSTW